MRAGIVAGAISAAILAWGVLETGRSDTRPPDGPMIGNPSCGTRPGNVGHGTALVPSGRHQLAIFAQGCF